MLTGKGVISPEKNFCCIFHRKGENNISLPHFSSLFFITFLICNIYSPFQPAELCWCKSDFHLVAVGIRSIVSTTKLWIDSTGKCMLLLTGKGAWNKEISTNLSHPLWPQEASHGSGAVAHHEVSWHVAHPVPSQCHQRMVCERKDPLTEVDLQDEYSHFMTVLCSFPVYLSVLSRMILVWPDPHLRAVASA